MCVKKGSARFWKLIFAKFDPIPPCVRETISFEMFHGRWCLALFDLLLSTWCTFFMLYCIFFAILNDLKRHHFEPIFKEF